MTPQPNFSFAEVENHKNRRLPDELSLKPKWVICQNFIAIVSKLFHVKIKLPTPFQENRSTRVAARVQCNGVRICPKCPVTRSFYSPLGSWCRLQLWPPDRNIVDIFQNCSKRAEQKESERDDEGGREKEGKIES